MIQNQRKLTMILTFLVATSTIIAGCLGGDDNEDTLIQTGSSTVLPLAIIWAEDFDGAEVTISGGGSSHGIAQLLKSEADLGDASRLMKGKDYVGVGCPEADVNPDGTAKAACNGIMPHKWVVAFDVLVVVLHNDNSYATELNYTQLYKIFTDDDPADYWDEIPGLSDTAPHAKIEIYAPDEGSGTYDFFFEEIIENWGKDDQITGTRLDAGDGVYHPSADDNVILNAIKENEFAIGYFGFAYYNENKDKVQTVDIADDDDNYEAAVLDNVANYPMSRPLHIYTDDNSDKRETVAKYLQFIYSDDGQKVIDEVGYVQVSAADATLYGQMRDDATNY